MSTSKNRSFGPAMSMDSHSQGIDDPRPSKLREAMARMSGNNLALQAAERAAHREKLASLNQRNRERFGRKS